MCDREVLCPPSHPTFHYQPLPPRLTLHPPKAGIDPCSDAYMLSLVKVRGCCLQNLTQNYMQNKKQNCLQRPAAGLPWRIPLKTLGFPHTPPGQHVKTLGFARRYFFHVFSIPGRSHERTSGKNRNADFFHSTNSFPLFFH